MSCGKDAGPSESTQLGMGGQPAGTALTRNGAADPMSPTHDSSAAEPTRSIGSDRIGRRSNTKGDRRQQLILDEAEHLLEQRSSWRAVGIDDVATAAEISRSAFYFYYDSKDALLAALVNRS